MLRLLQGTRSDVHDDDLMARSITAFLWNCRKGDRHTKVTLAADGATTRAAHHRGRRLASEGR